MDALLLMLHVQTAAPAAVVLAEAPVVQSEAVIRLLGAKLHLKLELASYPEALSQTRSSCDVASSSLQVTQEWQHEC